MSRNHAAQETRPPGGHIPRIVIVGGGFAGANLACALERKFADAHVDLLSEENYITYDPLLPEVVGASIMPGHAVAPLRHMVHRARVRMVHVTAIDFETRRVHYAGEGPGHLDYDHLILACGARAKLDPVPGMERWALPLKTLGDALYLRNRIIARLEEAELATDPDRRRWLTTFVVVGGGFSGVEVAGEIVDFLHAARRYYPRLREPARVALAHAGERLLPELPSRLGKIAGEMLQRKGVDVLLSTRTEEVNARGLGIAGGQRVDAGTTVTTIGIQTNPLVSDLPQPKDKGRIVTEADMRLPGRSHAWALGDCAAVVNAFDGAMSPPTAQFAIAQADQLAANIARFERGKPTRPFRYRPRGFLAAVGHRQAVALIWNIPLAGFLPWLLWRGYYLLRVPTLARKTRIFLEWNWGLFFPPDVVHLRFSRTRRPPQDEDADRPA